MESGNDGDRSMKPTAGRVGTTSTTPPLVARLRDTVGNWATDKLRELLAALDDALFERAVSATSSAEQNQHFEAMRELRARREDFIATTLRTLERRCVQMLDDRALRAAPPAVPRAWSVAVQAALVQHEAVL